MNAMTLLNAIENIDDTYISSAQNEMGYPLDHSTTSASHTAGSGRLARRWITVFVAATLALCLMGAGIAAAIYGDSIQRWFSHYWGEITGQPMSEGHSAVIEHVSQEIGVSQTVGDVTITVDSATVGDDNFFLLLKVDGVNFPHSHSYDFQNADMETKPDPLVDGAFVGYGIDYLGLDGDGSTLLLLNYKYSSSNGYVQDTRPLEVWLTLQSLVRGADADRQQVVSKGEWHFAFAIDRSQLLEVIFLPDTQAMAMVLGEHEEAPVAITDIELTNTGLRFQYEYELEKHKLMCRNTQRHL